MLYRVGEFMAGTETETPDGGQRRARGSTIRDRLLRQLGRADPSRLATPTGERIIDIYRRAYVNGGMTTAEARVVHLIWFRECLRSVPSVLMIGMPSVLLVALALSGIAMPPAAVWAAVLYSTAADVVLAALWYATIGAQLHARGIALPLRTLAGFVAITLAVAAGHAALHRLDPDLFVELKAFLPLLLPFQLLLFWVFHFAFDVHIDYALVTRRWTDTPLQRLLPYDKRGKLIFLRASDHYVIVRTTKGEHELRMRFADALERLDNARGLQVHRSFWVAQDYLSTPHKDGRRMVMRVEGVAIPISATYRDMVVRHLDLSSQG